jgi:molybdopterin-guanine dinucleotide biosynthesis protein
MTFDPTRADNLHFNGAADPVEEERARLETDIAVAKARLLAAQHQAAQLDAQTKQTMRAELAASRETLAALDHRHAEAVRLVRERADREIEQILTDARDEADLVTTGAGRDEGPVGS